MSPCYVCKALAVDPKGCWRAVLDHVCYDCDQAQANECCCAVDHDACCDVDQSVVVECSVSFHIVIVICYSYILSGDQRSTLAKFSGPEFRTRLQPGQDRGPGPGSCPGKRLNPARNPDSQARTAADPDPGKGQTPGQTREKHRGPPKKK